MALKGSQRELGSLEQQAVETAPTKAKSAVAD